MFVRVQLTEDSVATVGRGPFLLGHKRNFEFQKSELIDKNIDKLRGKKVIFIPGGTGRLTHYAQTLGVDAYCLDASSVCRAVCEKNYPSVPFLQKDMTYELEGFDYAVFEDVQWHLPRNDSLKAVANWQKVTKIIPESVSYKVIHFDSDDLDNYFGYVEPEGKAYFKKQLKSGIVTSYCKADELVGAKIQKYSIDLNKPLGSFSHKPDANFTYMGILDDADPEQTNLVIRIHNDGMDYNYNSNSRLIVPVGIPEKIRTGMKE